MSDPPAPDDHLLERVCDLLVRAGIDPDRLASAGGGGSTAAVPRLPLGAEAGFADETGCVAPVKAAALSPSATEAMTTIRDDGEDREDDDGRLQLSESFYTLIFTAKSFLSLPCAMALMVFAISVVTLVICGVDLLRQTSGWSLDIPPGVPNSVRVAQYIALFLGVLLEEEIPEAIEVLTKVCWKRNATTSSFRYRVILSVSCRIVIGYVFLIVLFIIVVQADQVLDIFFNMLALQFVEQVDDTVFTLAKRGALGFRLRNATHVDTVVLRRCEVEESDLVRSSMPGCRKIQLYSYSKRFMRNIPLIVFSLNLAALCAGFLYVHIEQDSGEFNRCSTISVNFGEQIWEHPNIVGGDLKGDNSFLSYSFFNGVYKIEGNDKVGRPVYVEMNKQNGEKYEKTTPAKFMFCQTLGSWAFVHKDLRKSTELTEEESDCPWLLKSEPVTGSAMFDLLSVASSSQWTVWTGTEKRGEEITILCDECENESSCNFKGSCNADTQSCDCSSGFFGSHCELEPPCTEFQTDDGKIFKVIPAEGHPPFVTSYGRPVAQISNMPASFGVQYIGSYAGNRWFGNFIQTNDTDYARKFYSEEYHGYWGKAFDSNTAAFSDLTDGSDPVGINWYEIRFRGGDYGPFGYTTQLTETEAGKGYFHCLSNRCENIQKGVAGACGEDVNLTCPREYKPDHSRYHHDEEQQCVCSNGKGTGQYGYFCEFGHFFLDFYAGRQDYDDGQMMSEIFEDGNWQPEDGDWEWEEEGEHAAPEEQHDSNGPSKKRPLVKCGATGCLPVIGKLSPPATTAQRLSDSVTLTVATVPQRLGWMLISATFARTPTVVASQEGKWTLTSRTLDRNESVSRVHDFLTSKFVAL
eukprot:CAMPEP_0113568750 /NCGR_PEP_ID=MMETSP0015_2-20120614/24025_1 /TAXON_ID=2838 /ORGANISM="Odontella" /LENGTH=860 /DNA_ID=CAMNT_0000471331 /DNA_START=122 /DNA_END=2705 /DNA_ORIENTATION=+ /assembly_acc=CAM_ASM_000160